MNTHSTLKQQGSPILLLAHLFAQYSYLPAPSFGVHADAPGVLDINLHPADGTDCALAAFEAWRVALGLGEPEARYASSELAWLRVEGVVADVQVRLVGYSVAENVETYTAAPLAVAA